MKLSIITVNLNNREGLKKTLDSVACQTWRDFEHIIIDGASTDGSVDVIREYAHGFESRSICQEPSATNTSTHVAQPQTHQHISQPSAISHQPYTIKWVSEPDKGIYNAMNKGIRMATGEYLQFLNSGDCFFSHETLSKVFSQSLSGDILYGDICFMDKNGTIVEKRHYSPELSFNFLMTFSLGHNATFMKRSLFASSGYDESYKIVSDKKFFLQKALQGCQFEYINVIVSFFVMDGVSSCNTDVVIEEESEMINTVVPNMIQRDCFSLSKYEALFKQGIDDVSYYYAKKTKYKKLIDAMVRIIRIIDKYYVWTR